MNVVSSVPIGKKAVVADVHEAFGQNVEKESAKELDGIEGHGALTIVVSVVLPPEGHAIFLEREESLVRDSDSMSVAREVLEDLLGSSERGLGINDPVLVAKTVEKTFPGSWMLQMEKPTVKLELLVVEGTLKASQELAPEQSRENAYGEEESVTSVDPAFAVRAQSASGNHAVQMRVGLKGLAPGMENGQDAELGSEVFRVAAEREKSLRSGAEENAVEKTTILERQRDEFVRSREDDVEVLDVEKLPLSALEPGSASARLALGAMAVSTGVVHHYLVGTALASLDVTAESGRPTFGQGIQDSILLPGRVVVLDEPGALGADDIGHLGPM